MPRNMSFKLTTDQIKDKSKTVTRRMGWRNLKPSEIVNACVQCQGLKKGQTIEKICQIRIKSTRSEPLNKIDKEDCIKEGFPNWKPEEYIDLFCRHNNCENQTMVNRIEFEYM